MKRNWRLFAGVGLALVAVAVVAVGIKYGALSNDKAATSTTTTFHTVVYQADAAGARGARSGSITLRSGDGGTQQAEVSLPLRTKAGEIGLTYTGFRSNDSFYLSVQNKDSAGSVTCRVLVDGVKVSENTSSGAYTIAACSGRVA